MICPQCKTEVLPDADRCPNCDISLVEDEEWVEVCVFGSRVEADLAGTALDSAGIDYFLGGEALGKYGPLTSFVSGIPLRVRKSDAEEARAILSPAPPIDDGDE